MKVLVFGHALRMSGTAINTIELCAALRDLHGYEVVLFATPGPAATLAHERGLRFIPAPASRFHPSPARIRALRKVILQERPDVIHAWEWYQYVDSYYVAHLLMRIPMVVTDMEMTLQRVLPKALLTTYGTPELVDRARAAGRRRPELLLPPVDAHLNAPGAADDDSFRDRYKISSTDITLVTVSRLDECLKAESLRRTIEVVRTLGRHLPIRFVLVGDGTVRTELENFAANVNTELGRQAVVLTGELLDPRPAYAAADVVIGMGGSALRGMAFGKPVVVVGEQGFSSPFTPESAPFFYYKGFYGIGDRKDGGASLAIHIRTLALHRHGFAALGEFSRQFVLKHFALERVASRLVDLFHSATTDVPRFHVAFADGIRTAAMWIRERRFLPSGV